MTKQSFARGLGNVLIGVLLLMSSSPAADRFELPGFYARDVRARKANLLAGSDGSCQPARVESY